MRRTTPISVVGANLEPERGRRPIGLCSLQFGDTPLEKLVEWMTGVGFDRIELGCSPKHFDVDRALDEPGYCDWVKKTLANAEIGSISLATHSTGLPLCGWPLDPSYRPFVGEEVWGDGDYETMYIRSADRLKRTAQAAKALGVEYVKLFFGSRLYGRQQIDFPPRDPQWVEDQWGIMVPRMLNVLDAFGSEGIFAALEAHKGELAYNTETMLELLQRLSCHERFTFNGDPSHWEGQGIDPAALIRAMPNGVFHVVHIKGAARRPGGTRSVLSPLPMGDPDRGWNYVGVEFADTDWRDCIMAFNENGLPADSELSLEQEDNGSDLFVGAEGAYNYMVGGIDFLAPSKSYEDGMTANA